MESHGIAFGIVSYLPSREPDRSLRKERLDRLFRNVKNVFGNVRYLIVAQNWGDYRMPPFVRADVFRHERGLGILKARNELRGRFLSSGADWLVMLDDDCMIRETAAGAGRRFLKSLEGREEGFCFRKDGKGEYSPSQLNLCAISKELYGKEPLPPIDPEKDEGFEDLTWSNFLHFKHPEMEFDMGRREAEGLAEDAGFLLRVHRGVPQGELRLGGHTGEEKEGFARIRFQGRGQRQAEGLGRGGPVPRMGHRS